MEPWITPMEMMEKQPTSEMRTKFKRTKNKKNPGTRQNRNQRKEISMEKRLIDNVRCRKST